MSNKFEQLLDLIVNEETEKAEQLFHEIVVERSRNIYESLLQDAEQDVQEKVGGNAVDAMIDDIETEEEEVTVEADEEGEEGAEDMSAELPMEPEMGDEGGEEGDVEERLDDIEAMLQQFQDELDTALAKIDGEEAGEEGDEEMELPTDDMGGNDEEVAGEAAPGLVREYKEKVGEPFKGGKVAASGKGDGEKSPVATKGGTMPTAKGVDFTKSGADGKHDAPGAYSNNAKSMNATTEPNLQKKGEAYKSGGAAAGKGDGVKSPVQGA